MRTRKLEGNVCCRFLKVCRSKSVCSVSLSKAGKTVDVLSNTAYLLRRLLEMSYCSETPRWLYYECYSAETSHYNHFKQEIYSAYFHLCL